MKRVLTNLLWFPADVVAVLGILLAVAMLLPVLGFLEWRIGRNPSAKKSFADMKTQMRAIIGV